MGKKEEGKEEEIEVEDIDIDKESLQVAVREEVGKQVSSLLATINKRDEDLKTWQKERDEQWGAHLSDFKRSLDAMNARHAQYSHRIDAMKEELMTKFKPAPIPESPKEEPKPRPPKEEGPPPIPPEEKPPEEPKEPEEPAEPVEEMEETLFIGECQTGHHFFEAGEEHLKFCPEDGSRIIKYPKPKKLKTKK